MAWIILACKDVVPKVRSFGHSTRNCILHFVLLVLQRHFQHSNRRHFEPRCERWSVRCFAFCSHAQHGLALVKQGAHGVDNLHQETQLRVSRRVASYHAADFNLVSRSTHVIHGAWLLQYSSITDTVKLKSITVNDILRGEILLMHART